MVVDGGKVFDLCFVLCMNMHVFTVLQFLHVLICVNVCMYAALVNYQTSP